MELGFAVGFGGEAGGPEVATKDGFSKAFSLILEAFPILFSVQAFPLILEYE